MKIIVVEMDIKYYLKIAIENGLVQVVQFCLDASIDIMFDTILLPICFDKQHFEIAKMLLAAGAIIEKQDLEKLDERVHIFLRDYFDSDVSDYIPLIIRNAKSIKKQQTHVMDSTLYDIAYVACGSGRLDVVKFFCRYGYTINPDCFNNACRAGHMNVVDFLIDQGLKPTPEALENALGNWQYPIANYLYQLDDTLITSDIIKSFIDYDFADGINWILNQNIHKTFVIEYTEKCLQKTGKYVVRPIKIAESLNII